MSDDYYCPSCWDKRTSPAPARCTRPGLHNHEEAVKVEIIVHRGNGDVMKIMSDDFEYVEFETIREQVQWLDRDSLFKAVPLGKMDLILTVKRAGTYKIWQQRPEPVAIDDGNVVEEGGEA